MSISICYTLTVNPFRTSIKGGGFHSEVNFTAAIIGDSHSLKFQTLPTELITSLEQLRSVQVEAVIMR